MTRQNLLLLALGIVIYFGIINRQQTIESAVNMALDTTNLMRGERLNNPFNIIKSTNAWQGLSADQSADPYFATFNDALYGIRAGVKLISTYFEKYGLNTVRGIISKFAPPSENNTQAYIQAVAKTLQITPDTPLNLDQDSAFALAKAIINHEQGRIIYDDALIAQGVNMGLA